MDRVSHVLRDPLLGYIPGFVNAIKAFVGIGDILVGVAVFGIDAHRHTGASQSLFLLPDGLVAQSEVVARRGIARIGLYKLLVDLDGLVVVLVDNVVVMRRYVQSFAFAGSLLQVKCLGDKTRGQLVLGKIAVSHAEGRIRQGKVGVEFDGALEMRNGLGIIE